MVHCFLLWIIYCIFGCCESRKKGADHPIAAVRCRNPAASSVGRVVALRKEKKKSIDPMVGME